MSVIHSFSDGHRGESRIFGKESESGANLKGDGLTLELYL